MKLKFTLFIVGIIVLVGVLGFFLNKPAGPSKYDDFAKALTSQGAEFFGAFWCPHCQAEKALFGSAKQYLPYIECSKADKSQTQICIDNKIESYPSWRFKDGIRITSASKPIVCSAYPGVAGESERCKNVASPSGRTWLFEEAGFSIKSPSDPMTKGNEWIFPKEAMATGEIPLQFLADQIKYTLPQ